MAFFRSSQAMIRPAVFQVLLWLLPTFPCLGAGPVWTVYLVDVSLPDELDGLIDVTRSESIEFLPDSRSIATAGLRYDSATQDLTGEVLLRSVEDGAVQATLRGTAVSYALRAGTLAVAPTGNWIAAAGRTEDNTRVIDLFDAWAMKLLRTLRGDPSPVVWVQFSPDEDVLAAAHLRGAVELWDFQTGRLISRIAPHDHGVWPIAFTPDGESIAVGNGDGSFTLWQVDSGQRLAHAEPKAQGRVGAIDVSPDGSQVALGGTSIAIWEIERDNASGGVVLRHEFNLHGHSEHTYSVKFSPDGEWLASANQDATVRIWDLERRETVRIIEHADFTYDVAFSSDGKLLATLSRDSLLLWRWEELLGKD
jgi:WD40 repeat protein